MDKFVDKDKTIVSYDSNFSQSTTSPINFHFSENLTNRDSDTDVSQIDSDSDYDPKNEYSKRKKIIKLTKNERYKELLKVLNESYTLIHVIKDKLHERIQMKGDVDLDLFTNGTLRPYQVVGYQWLVSLFENGLSGILGDEMGLGKTIEVIAFLCYLLQFGIDGPFLIVCPLSTLPNWMYEFNRFVPKIPIIFYHGQKREDALASFKMTAINITDSRAINIYPIIITSYEIAMNDLYVFKDVKFRALIVDEGHRIRNFNSKLLNCLKRYQSDMRIILTGTPLQNNLSELWCLFHFLVPEVFYCVESFENWFKCKSTHELFRNEVLKEEEERALITTIHKIISPFILRRLKSEVKISIPPKKEVVLSVSMTNFQQELYDKAVQRSLNYLNSHSNLFENTDKLCESKDRATRRLRKCKTKSCSSIIEEIDEIIRKFLNNPATIVGFDESKSQTISKEPIHPDAEIHFQNRNIVMLLRKLCNHPYMIRYPLNKLGHFNLSQELIDSSGKMKVLDALLMRLKKEDHKVLIFSQFNNMLDILQDYLNFKKWKYSRLDGSMSLENRQDQIFWFNSESNIFCFLLNTKAGGVGLNLSSADTVIIYDSDWNPQNDIQAQDRCHRIGQSTPVLVFKLVLKNSIDQEIFDRAEVKRTLEKMVLHDKKFKGDFFVESHTNTDEEENVDFNVTEYDTETFSFNCMSKEEMTEILTQKREERYIGPDDNLDKDIASLLDRSMLQKECKGGEG